MEGPLTNRAYLHGAPGGKERLQVFVYMSFYLVTAPRRPSGSICFRFRSPSIPLAKAGAVSSSKIEKKRERKRVGGPVNKVGSSDSHKENILRQGRP